MKDLQEAFDYEVHYLFVAGNSGSKPTVWNAGWAYDLVQNYLKGKLEPDVSGPMETAMIWRKRLVDFAGEEAVIDMEKHLPRRQVSPYHGGYGGDELQNAGQCNTGDFGSTRQIFVPGEGLKRSRL